MSSIFAQSKQEKRRKDLASKGFGKQVEKAIKTCKLEEDLELFLYDIEDAIMENQILLIQEEREAISAYLIPTLLAYQNSTYFNRFIIATSSFEAAIKIQDKIKELSQLLEIDLPVHALEGEENYLCLRRLQKHARQREEETLQQASFSYQLHPQLFKRQDWETLSDVDWEKIHVKNCSFQKCQYYSKCRYRLMAQSIYQEGCTIISHETLVGNERYSVIDPIYKDADFVLIEEADNLANNVKKHYQNSIHFEVVSKYFRSAIRQLAKEGVSFNREVLFTNLISFFQGIETEESLLSSETQKRADILANFAYTAGIHLTRTMLDQKYRGNIEHSFDILAVIESFFRDIANGCTKYSYQISKREGNEAFRQVEIVYQPQKVDRILQNCISQISSSIVLTGKTIAGEDDEYAQLVKDCALDHSEREIVKEYVYK